MITFEEHYQKDFEWGEEIEFPSTKTFKQYTHRIFSRYPARSISLVPRILLTKFRSLRTSNSLIIVLDPFMGSGTTGIEALLLGMKPFGVELDPFARLVSEVSMSPFSEKDIAKLKRVYEKISKLWPGIKANTEYDPVLYNIHYWFEDRIFDDLLKIKTAIYQVSENHEIQNFFRIILADMIRPCSKAERQTLKPYISKKYKKIPAEVSDAFDKSFRSHYEAIKDFSQALPNNLLKLDWLGTDATHFRTDDLIDIAITSPPYINALDYIRCIKIESAWIDCANTDSLKKLKPFQIGDSVRNHDAQNSIVSEFIEDIVLEISRRDKSRALIVTSYFNDMYKNLYSVYHSLKRGGIYHIIVGNSNIRKIDIPTHEVLAKIAEKIGFKWVGFFKYKIKDHRLSIPRNNNGGKIKYENVISLKKI